MKSSRANLSGKLANMAVLGLLIGFVSSPAISGTTEFNNRYTTYKVLPSGGTHIWQYNCANDEHIVSGGFDSVFNNSYGKGIRLVESYPSSTKQWRWTFYNKGPKPAQYRLAYICAK